jgi:hypothetical protein
MRMRRDNRIKITHRYQLGAEVDDSVLLREVDIPVVEIVLFGNLEHLCACLSDTLQALVVFDRHARSRNKRHVV